MGGGGGGGGGGGEMGAEHLEPRPDRALGNAPWPVVNGFFTARSYRAGSLIFFGPKPLNFIYGARETFFPPELASWRPCTNRDNRFGYASLYARCRFIRREGDNSNEDFFVQRIQPKRSKLSNSTL